MTTSYIREAQKKLKAEKKILRAQEAKEQKAALEAAEKAHQENMARIEKKMAKINGDRVFLYLIYSELTIYIFGLLIKFF